MSDFMVTNVALDAPFLQQEFFDARNTLSPTMETDSGKLYLREWRLALGLSQQQVAEVVGRDKSIISKIERDRSGFTRPVLSRLAAALKIGLADLFSPPPPELRALARGRSPAEALAALRSQGKPPESISFGGGTIPLRLNREEFVLPSPEEAEALAGAVATTTMPRDVPVLGTAAGSATGAIQVLGVVDYVRRPPALVGARGVYAIYIVGDSMDPEHKDGDLRFVHPLRPIQVGDTVIIQIKNGEHEPTEAFIKRLARRTGDMVVVSQINPTATIEFKKSAIVHMHKVLRMNELFGV